MLVMPSWGMMENSPGDPVPPFRLYNTSDGMSQTRVHALTQDKHGYLWLATVRGLNRFDGNEFKPITIRHGLRTNPQFSLYVDDVGDIWSGDVTGGVSRIRNSQVIETIPPPTEAAARLKSLAVIEHKVFRSIAGKGLYQTDLKDTEKTTLLTESAPDKLIVKDGHLIFVIQEKLYAWKPNTSFKEAMIANSFKKAAIGSGTGVYLLSKKGEVFLWDADGLQDTQFKIPANVSAFTVDKNGQVWYVFEDTLVTPNKMRMKLPVKQVIDAYVDRDGVIWIAGGNGLVRYLGSRFKHLPLGPSAPSRVVFGGSEDVNGTKWFATEGGLIARYADGRVISVSDEIALPSGRAVAVEPYGTEYMLVSYPRNGIYQIPVSLQSSAKQLADTTGWVVTEITHDNEGNTWVLGARNGLLKYSDIKKTPEHIQLPDAGLAVSMSAVDEGGLVVAVRDVGIVRVQGEDVSVLPQTTGIEKRFIHLNAKSASSIWLVTSDGGVFHLQDDVLTQYAQDTDLSDQSVYFVEPINNDILILGAERGVYQLSLQENQLYHYGVLEGFIGIETNARSTFRDRFGYLWIGTILGATRMDTLFPMPVFPPLNPYIHMFTTDLKQSKLDADAVIEADDRGLNVGYVAVSPKFPDGIEYSYRLLGVDESWSLPTSLTSVRFATLPHGTYTFEVKARYRGHQWSEIARRKVVVKPHFWQTPWFIAGCILLSLLLIALAVQLRLSAIQRTNYRLKKQVALRTEHLEAEIAERKRSEAALIEAQEDSRKAHLELQVLNKRLQAQALTDDLTMLPNRRAFEKSLSQSMDYWRRTQLPVAVLFLDLNGFKAVNDTYGHDAGDELIRKIGKRLADLARTSDFVARLGGDEFVVIANNCSVDSASMLASRIAETVSAPVKLSFATVNISASIGIACCPEHANTASELMRKADLAMYFAKRNSDSVMARYDEITSKHQGAEEPE